MYAGHVFGGLGFEATNDESMSIKHCRGLRGFRNSLFGSDTIYTQVMTGMMTTIGQLMSGNYNETETWL